MIVGSSRCFTSCSRASGTAYYGHIRLTYTLVELGLAFVWSRVMLVGTVDRIKLELYSSSFNAANVWFHCFKIEGG